MKKLFARYRGTEAVEIRAVQTSEETYWDTIATMSKENYHQVILVEGILVAFIELVFQKGGKVTEIRLCDSPVEETDPHYEVPTPTFWEKLRRKTINPLIEEAHHRRHKEKTRHRMEETQKSQRKLNDLVASFTRGEGSQVKLEMIADILGNPIIQLSFIRVERNQEELMARTNGVYESNNESGTLGELLQNQVLEYLR